MSTILQKKSYGNIPKKRLGRLGPKIACAGIRSRVTAMTFLMVALDAAALGL